MAQTEEGQKVNVFSGSSRIAKGAAERDAEAVPGDRRDLHLEIVQLKAEVERLDATAAATSRAAMVERTFAEITAENEKLKQEIEELKVLASKANGGEIRGGNGLVRGYRRNTCANAESHDALAGKNATRGGCHRECQGDRLLAVHVPSLGRRRR